MVGFIAGTLLITLVLLGTVTFAAVMHEKNDASHGGSICTDHEVLSTETVVCGTGDSCSSNGINISVEQGPTAYGPMKSVLVTQQELETHTRQTQPVKFNSSLESSVLFSSSKALFYSMIGTMLSGECCITNFGTNTATVQLKIYSSFNSALHPSESFPVFNETMTVKSGENNCFLNWRTDKPFITQSNGYYFFSLSTSSLVDYTFEMMAKQVYVNITEYSPTIYFTATNYSYFTYRRCYDIGGLTKKKIDYVTLCQTSSEENVENHSLVLRSCSKEGSSPYKMLWLILIITFVSICVVVEVLIAVAAYYCCKKKVWLRCVTTLTETVPTERSQLLV